MEYNPLPPIIPISASDKTPPAATGARDELRIINYFLSPSGRMLWIAQLAWL
jgi:hypothetical protein